MFPAHDAGYRISYPKLRSGIKVRIVERGESGAHPVLFLPGWGASVFGWRENMPAVADAGFRAIAVDLKGSGLSDKPLGEKEYTSEAMIAHVGEILDALSLSRPTLVGHSLAASLSYRFARNTPERVTSIVLISPVGHAGVPHLGLYRRATPRFLRRVMPALCRRKLIEIALRRVYAGSSEFTEQDVDEYWAPSQFREFAIAQRDILHAFDWHDAVEGVVRVPTLLILGSKDHLVGKDVIVTYGKAIPGLEAQVIEGAGHAIPEQSPDAVNAALIRFLRSIGDRACLS